MWFHEGKQNNAQCSLFLQETIAINKFTKPGETSMEKQARGAPNLYLAISTGSVNVNGKSPRKALCLQRNTVGKVSWMTKDWLHNSQWGLATEGTEVKPQFQCMVLQLRSVGTDRPWLTSPNPPPHTPNSIPPHTTTPWNVHPKEVRAAEWGPDLIHEPCDLTVMLAVISCGHESGDVVWHCKSDTISSQKLQQVTRHSLTKLLSFYPQYASIMIDHKRRDWCRVQR